MPNEYGYALRRVADDIERYSLDQSKTKEWNMKVCLSAADYLDGLERERCGAVTTQSTINHPSHYCQSTIECIDAIAAATINLTGIEAVCTGNAIKYLWRWKVKGGLEDLEKAKRYIEMMIERSAEVNP